MIQHGSGEYEQMVALRHQLLRKPLGLHFSAEELANEKNNILLAYTDDGIMEACSMLVKQDDRTVRLTGQGHWTGHGAVCGKFSQRQPFSKNNYACPPRFYSFF